MSLAGGGWSRRGGSGSRFELPWQQPPAVVVDVGCSCRAPRLLLSSLISSLKSHARGIGVGKPKSSTHASSSSWSSSATTGFTSSTSITTATTTFSSSSLDHHHHHPTWRAPATCGENASAAVYEVDADADEHATRRERRRRRQQRRRRACGRAAAAPAAALGEETAVAVAVESAAPYEDFRESMVQMVREKEMYAWEDLNTLLQQFLALNSPRYHPLILTAFADLWAPRGGPFCPPSPCL